MQKYSYLFALIAFLGISACADITDSNIVVERCSDAYLTKWQNGHRAAVCLTFDHTWGETQQESLQAFHRALAESGVKPSFDFIPGQFTAGHEKYLADVLLPLGYQFFGHGYSHQDCDALTYSEAYLNFRKNYIEMKSRKLKAVSYAYPGGYNYEQETRDALRTSGFLCGRSFRGSDYAVPFTCADSSLVPADWYALPTMLLFNREWCNNDNCVHNNEEFIPFLEETLRHGAWLIMTYHCVSDSSWGTYSERELWRNIEEIKKRDVWIESFDDLTLYVYERSSAKIRTEKNWDKSGTLASLNLTLSDAYTDNDLYSIPLTVAVPLPNSWRNRTIGVFHRDTLLTTVRSDSLLLLNFIPNEQTYMLKVNP